MIMSILIASIAKELQPHFRPKSLARAKVLASLKHELPDDGGWFVFLQVLKDGTQLRAILSIPLSDSTIIIRGSSQWARRSERIKKRQCDINAAGWLASNRVEYMACYRILFWFVLRWERIEGRFGEIGEVGRTVGGCWVHVGYSSQINTE